MAVLRRYKVGASKRAIVVSLRVLAHPRAWYDMIGHLCGRCVVAVELLLDCLSC